MTYTPRLVAVIATAVLAVSAPRAAAETVNLGLAETPTSAQLTINYTVNGVPGSATASPGPYVWSQSGTIDKALPMTIATFCVQLDQHFPKASAPFTVGTVAAAVGATEASLITRLFAADYQTSWADPKFMGSLQSAAFQLALWEIVYDGPSNLNVATGNVYTPGANPNDKTTAAGLAQSWLNGLSSVPDTAFDAKYPNSEIVWLSNPNYQDQIAFVPKPSAVPAPPGVVLAAVGLLGLAGRRFARRSSAA